MEKTLQHSLAADAFIYEFLHIAFGAEPQKEHRAFFASEQFQNVFAEVTEDNECFDKIARFLRELGEKEAREAESSEPDRIDKLIKEEYVRLFIGPGKPSAAPWLSVYRDETRTIFNEYTLIVRSFYRSASFLPSQYPRVADDHIAIMMDFLAKMSSRALKALETEDKRLLDKTIETRNKFISSCVAPWIDSFADAVCKSKTHYFYPQIAEFLSSFVASKSDQ